jgi:hypothetical protein
MQIKFKSAIAAVALAVASTVTLAAPPVVPTQPVVIPAPGLPGGTLASDPLYVAVWDSITGKSLTQYLGLNYGQVGIADMTANLGFNLNTNSNFANAFAGSTLSNLRFEVFSSSTNNAADTVTVLTTSNQSSLDLSNPIYNTNELAGNVIGAAGAITLNWTQDRMNLANVCARVNPCVGTDFNDVKSFANPIGNNYAGNLAAFSGFSSAGSIGSTLSFYALTANTVSDIFSAVASAEKYLGTWSLSSEGLLSYNVAGSEVPVPAALWLLLSGLTGMGVVGRRRKGAALAAA